MSDKRKVIEPIPEEFVSYEEAAEFWDAHDTADYPDNFEAVAVEARLQRRRYEVEIDADLLPELSERAHDQGVNVSRLVSEILRENIRRAA